MRLNEEDDEDEEQPGILHSGFRNDDKSIMVMDNEHFYILIIALKLTIKLENQNCIGMYLLDNNYLYTLSHKSKTFSSGFRLYDLENCEKVDSL